MSRALREIGDDIARIGAGPSIQYALRDAWRGFRSAPIYRITTEGRVKPPGELIPVRPEEYFGRAYASTHAAKFGLPTNPEQWGDSDVVRALLAQDHDAIGNLLTGERARERFSANFGPCLETLGRHLDDARSRIARLG